MSSGDVEEGGLLAGVDRVIHEPARFSVMAHLYAVESADFLFISRHTGLTRGNLSSHMRRLEEAGYIEVRKGFVGRRPHTVLAITKRGREAFRAYVSGMRDTLGRLEM